MVYLGLTCAATAGQCPARMEGKDRTPVIGLLGGIGSGKSAVAAELSKLGCGVVDADKIGHELLGAPEIQRRLRRQWGRGIFTERGDVDRGALGRIVFADPDQLEVLQRILHPKMGRRIGERIEQLRAQPGIPAVVLDAAVLLEAGWDRVCTHLLFVQAGPKQRYRRAAVQRGWEREQWRRREKSQISLDIKAAKCDYSIDNSSTVSHLVEQVRQVFDSIVRTANRP